MCPNADAANLIARTIACRFTGNCFLTINQSDNRPKGLMTCAKLQPQLLNRNRSRNLLPWSSVSTNPQSLSHEPRNTGMVGLVVARNSCRNHHLWNCRLQRRIWRAKRLGSFPGLCRRGWSMIKSKRNLIWGRLYDVGQNETGRWQFVCSTGGPRPKLLSLHLAEFDREPILMDRKKFAEFLRQHRKNERTKNNA